ncbi:MAG: hypothetical protein OEM01_15530, partial [Desulfobulbaceae bacterium]|nr:hypothetical protein [Desulfobulbaceae bacterium]
MNRHINQCPGCGYAGEATTLYHCNNIPVNSVTLFRKRQEAVNCRKGDIHLTCCSSCGLIYNKEYDPLACHYNEEYEESQSHSQVFTAFHYELADY